MNYTRTIFLMFVSITAVNVSTAKMVEYVEDAYCMQAPQAIADKAAHIAQNIGYTQPYEIVAAKKPGLQVNPWNRFISCGTNPATKNWFILVNPEWFNLLPSEQQEFLLSRCFITGQTGMNTLPMKLIPWLFVILSWLAIYAIYRLLSLTVLVRHKPVVRILIALGIVMACNILFVNKLQTSLIQYFGRKHDVHLIKATVEKTKNKQAAIDALSTIDKGIKTEVEQGEAFFAPHKELFAGYVEELKK